MASNWRKIGASKFVLFSAYQLARSESDGAAILLASTGKDVNLTARSASWNLAKDVAALIG